MNQTRFINFRCKTGKLENFPNPYGMFGCENCFYFSRKRFQKMELSFHFQFSMKIFENAFGWNCAVFISHFKKLENALRKFWKTTKISFLTYIEVRKQKIFIFLENIWKLNEPNAFSKFSFSLKIFLEKLKKIRQPNAPLGI